MTKPVTRRGLENLIREAEKSLGNIRNDLVNEEVVDLAINIRGTLSTVSQKYGSEAIVDLIPDITSALNRLDASVTLSNDLKNNISDLLEETKLLAKLLEKEQEKRRECFEESLNSEEKAEEEIKRLKIQIENLYKNQSQLKEELKNKDVVINILKCESNSLYQDINRNKTKTKQDTEFTKPNKTFKAKENSEDIYQINTSNRYSALADEGTQSPPCAGSKIKVNVQIHRGSSPPIVPRKNKSSKTCGNSEKKKRRLALLADSQGKEFSVFLKELEEDFDIFVYARSGAKIKNIIRDSLSMIKDFTEEDFIIVLGGSNDLDPYEPAQLTVDQGMRSLLSLDLKTNIIMCSIPYRYDEPSVNNDIFYTNNTIKRMIYNYKGLLNLSCVGVNALLTRAHFTRHGLHYNKRGKQLLADHFSRLIRQATSSSPPPLTAPPQHGKDTCSTAAMLCAPVQGISSDKGSETSLIEPHPDQSTVNELPNPDTPVLRSSHHKACENPLIEPHPDQSPENESFPAPDTSVFLLSPQTPTTTPLKHTLLPYDEFPPLRTDVHSDCNRSFLGNQSHISP